MHIASPLKRSNLDFPYTSLKFAYNFWWAITRDNRTPILFPSSSCFVKRKNVLRIYRTVLSGGADSRINNYNRKIIIFNSITQIEFSTRIHQTWI